MLQPARKFYDALQWRHNERGGVSNHRRLGGLLSRLFRRRSKKASKLRVTDVCEGNPPVTGGFPSQRASDAEMFPFDDVIMDCLSSQYITQWQRNHSTITVSLLNILRHHFAIHYAPVPLAGDATALVRRTKIWTDTQQHRRDGLVEHLRCYYFACVAYQLRINGAWVTHMRRMNGDATTFDVAYENLTIAYPRRKRRMHSVHPTYARRSTRFYGVRRAYVQRMGCVHAESIKTPHYILVVTYMWDVNVAFKCPVDYLNVQFYLTI